MVTLRVVSRHRPILTALGAVFAVAAFPASPAEAKCGDYSNQAAAQRGADTNDGDRDGVYCESLPCPCLKGGPVPADNRPVARRLHGRVARIVDGDSIHVTVGGKRLKVRLLGIDAPESSPSRFGHVQCGGARASRTLRRI